MPRHVLYFVGMNAAGRYMSQTLTRRSVLLHTLSLANSVFCKLFSRFSVVTIVVFQILLNCDSSSTCYSRPVWSPVQNQSSAASMQLLYSITKYHMHSKQLWAGHAISFSWLDGIKGL